MKEESGTDGPAPFKPNAKDTLNAAASSKDDSPNASLDSLVVEGISPLSQTISQVLHSFLLLFMC